MDEKVIPVEVREIKETNKKMERQCGRYKK
jgi:hypothetical protein